MPLLVPPVCAHTLTHVCVSPLALQVFGHADYLINSTSDGILVDTLCTKAMAARNKTGFWYAQKEKSERFDRLNAARKNINVQRIVSHANSVAAKVDSAARIDKLAAAGKSGEDNAKNKKTRELMTKPFDSGAEVMASKTSTASVAVVREMFRKQFNWFKTCWTVGDKNAVGCAAALSRVTALCVQKDNNKLCKVEVLVANLVELVDLHATLVTELEDGKERTLAESMDAFDKSKVLRQHGRELSARPSEETVGDVLWAGSATMMLGFEAQEKSELSTLVKPASAFQAKPGAKLWAQVIHPVTGAVYYWNSRSSVLQDTAPEAYSPPQPLQAGPQGPILHA